MPANDRASGERTAGEPAASRQAGFILLLVLWIALILAVLAAGFMASTRSHLQLASAAVEAAKAEAVADTGVSLAILDLVAGIQDAKRTGRVRVDGSPFECTLDGQGTVTLLVQDEGGRVNINLASDRLLAAFLSGLGAAPDVARRTADLIIDYRDADDVRRPGGAEKADYGAAGRVPGPKNGPFDTAAELHQVLGIDRALVAAALPFITVHSSVPGLDPEVASHALAEIISRGAVALGAPEPFGNSNVELIPKDMAGRSRRRELRIVSIGRAPGGASFAREAVVDLMSAGNGVPALKIWTSSSIETPAPEPSTPPPPPC